MVTRRDILAGLIGILAARAKASNAAHPGGRKPYTVPPSPPNKGRVTPAFDRNGNVLDSWWARLPLNQWLEVMGTDMNSLLSAVDPAWFDWGSGRRELSGPFASYGGASFDYNTGRMWVSSGGHSASNNNGYYELNLEKMAWRVAVHPSVYNWGDVHHAQSSWLAYNGSVIIGIGGQQSYGYDAPTFVWKDGKHVATHTYHLDVYVPELGKIFTSVGRAPGHADYRIWSIDPVAGTETTEVMYGSYWMSDSTTNYDPVNHNIFAFRTGEGISGYKRYNVLTKTLSGELNSSRLLNCALSVIVGRKVFFLQTTHAGYQYPVAFTMDLDTQQWADVPLIDAQSKVANPNNPGQWLTRDQFATGDYCPATGLVYSMRYSRFVAGELGKFTTVNPVTGQCGVYQPQGTPPTWIHNGLSLYGKVRCYERSTGAYLIVYPEYNQNLRIVRLA